MSSDDERSLLKQIQKVEKEISNTLLYGNPNYSELIRNTQLKNKVRANLPPQVTKQNDIQKRLEILKKILTQIEKQQQMKTKERKSFINKLKLLMNSKKKRREKTIKQNNYTNARADIKKKIETLDSEYEKMLKNKNTGSLGSWLYQPGI